MNVLYLQDHAGIGGAQLSLLDFFDGLRISRPGVTPQTVVGSDGFLTAQLIRRGLSTAVIRFPEYRKARDFFWRPRFLRRLTHLCQQRQVDLIHANTSRVAPWSVRLGRALGLASCVTLREVSAAAHVEKYRVLENDAVIAISRAVQAEAPASPKVRQIYDGIACPQFLPSKADAWTTLRIPPQAGLKVGFLGTLSARKGPQVLVEAAALVLQRVPGCVFVFIGDGEAQFKRQLQAQAGRFGIARSLFFAGPIENGASCLQAFDLLVAPSFTEGIGRAAVEAMYAGLPVVASRVGGLAEIVEDGETGRLVAPGQADPLAEAIVFYLEHEPQRLEHGSRGRQRAQTLFDPAQYAARVCGLYSELVGAGKRAKG
ncbi:MAG TPA: glycosyltransferase family 4 protein [Verrucomicrobiota bacterium]|nr:glycosyltransferase family 4 protein [Verrucomicrobiota bacterium]